MSQTLTQRKALGKARRVFCDRDLQPSRDEPAVLRVQPPEAARMSMVEGDDAYRPGPLGPAVILILATLAALGVVCAFAFGFSAAHPASLAAPTW